MSIDEFPNRDQNSELAEQSEAVFEQAVVEAQQFLIQQRDRRDYGTDFQLESKLSGRVTNFRIHVQLKSTRKLANSDGSISISVARKNLNYMLSQPNSIYVCYHYLTRALFVRSADDIFRDAEHKGENWRSQESLTIRFYTCFDAGFQSGLCAKAVAASSTLRDDRLAWVVASPDKFPEEAATSIPTITVPESPEDAHNALCALYERGKDDVISKAFGQFLSCFGPDDPRLTYAYLSEINLGMRRKRFNRERVSAAIDFIERSRPDNGADALYCRANGHSALQQNQAARHLYQEAIRKTSRNNTHLAAQCWKNLGTLLEQEGDYSGSRRCYEQAIELSPDLMEAHMGLAISDHNAGNLVDALHHFDHVVRAAHDVAATLLARGYRLDAYFRLGMTDKAFDDIEALLPHADQERWIFDWCARFVYNYARVNDSSVPRAIQFWNAFLRMQPRDRRAQRERLLCLAYAKMSGKAVTIDYARYISDVSEYLTIDSTDAAYFWDRIGHWAQVDKNWEAAEQYYRKAYSLEPERYGYCLGVTLNYLKRFKEALPILVEQATIHQPDALSWFQVAISQDGIGNISGCKESYHRALTLDPNHALAMFNLGGIYWNHGPKAQALSIWSDAIKRFPEHKLAEKLREEFPEFFTIAEQN